MGFFSDIIRDSHIPARPAPTADLTAWTPPEPRYERGYGYMFTKHIEQADKGCDFDFLRTEFGAPVDEPVIY